MTFCRYLRVSIAYRIDFLHKKPVSFSCLSKSIQHFIMVHGSCEKYDDGSVEAEYNEA